MPNDGRPHDFIPGSAADPNAYDAVMNEGSSPQKRERRKRRKSEDIPLYELDIQYPQKSAAKDHFCGGHKDLHLVGCGRTIYTPEPRSVWRIRVKGSGFEYWHICPECDGTDRADPRPYYRKP